MNFFIVAVDDKWGIAKDKKIPWHHKEDFQWFKKVTEGMHCVLGYNTYAEIAAMRGYPEKTNAILPGRVCHVITSKSIPESPFVLKHMRPETIINYYPCPFAFIGGVSIYDFAIEGCSVGCDIGYITRIKGDHECDTFFNHELLMKHFELEEVLGETDLLRFEKWTRHYTQIGLDSLKELG